MSNNRINYSLSLTELKYLVFSKKKCPNCEQSKMEKVTEKKYIGSDSTNIYYKSTGGVRKSYDATLLYRCKFCCKIYPIDELAK